MSSTTPDVARALLHAAAEINDARSVADTLDTIVIAAAASLPGIDHVGISLVGKGGAIATQAGSDALVWELDALQYEVDEGPCLEAIRDGGPRVVVVNDIAREQRWPRFVAAAVRMGLTAQIGIQLIAEGRVYGGLNMYATGVTTIDPDVEHLAELFAEHAGVTLGRARREEGLTTALSTRKVIGQAVGVVMARFELDEDRAFAFLTRVSQRSNVKLRDVAREIVEECNTRFRRT